MTDIDYNNISDLIVSPDCKQMSQSTTDFKRQYILQYMDFDSRLMVNSLSSLIITSVSLNLKAGIIRSTRNGLIGFTLLGTLIVPELMNPFLGMNQKE